LADVRELHASLVSDRPRGLAACVRWAKGRFDDLFVDGPRWGMHAGAGFSM